MMLAREMIMLTALPVALILLPNPGMAEVDTSEWLCESCPFATGYRASYEAGTTVVSDEAARFGNGSGYDDNGAYLTLGGQGKYVNDGYQLNWRLADLGLDSRAASVTGGRQGQYDFALDYRETPYRLFDSTRTIFDYRDGTLSLPAGWLRAGQTSAMTGLESSLRRQDIGSDRQHIEMGGRWLFGSGMRLSAGFSRQNKEGIDIIGGPGYTQSSLLPRAVDFQTDQLDLGLRYSFADAHLSLAYHGSYFSNQNPILKWETPFTTTPGASQLQMSQEPDNDFHQVSLSGVYNEATWNTAVAVSVALGQGEQNATFLPLTVNPDLGRETLPRSSLNGKVDTRNYALTITSRPTSASRLNLSYRLDEHDNRTASDNWSRVIVDLFDSGETEANRPYSYERGRLNLSARLRLRDNLRVAAGYDRTDYDRDLQEVAEQTESGGWGQLRWQANELVGMHARAGAAKRKINRYDTDLAGQFGQNPLLRKYNLAYRYREYGELSASATMKEKPLTLSATVYATDDSYTQSLLGITSSDALRISADLSWNFSESMSTYLVLGRETIDARQSGSEQGMAADWRATHDDTFDHIGLGLVRKKLTDKLDFSIDYSRGDGKTEIDFTSNSGGQSRLPNLESTLDSLRLEGLYHWSEKLDYRFSLRYERFASADWALQDVAAATLPTVLSLDADAYNYKVWALAIAFTYRLGNHNLALTN